MSPLTAIDVLVDPDDETLEQARAWNARMRESVPDGFALDATHQAHITTLQCYVRTAELDKVFDAVGTSLEATGAGALSYRATSVKHAEWGVPGQGLAVILVRPHPQVLDFQAALLAALSPFTEPRGTADAYVTDPGEDITQSTFDWVEGYVRGQVGGSYTPHVTVGFASLDDLARIEAEPFDAFDVHATSVAVYQLGNNGTARKLLERWPCP
jgi:hypothetical protein